MTITAVEITITENNKRQLADVAIVIDYSIKITNIKLIDNGDKKFVQFPKSQRRESNFSYPDVIPLTKKIRSYIEEEVIKEYYNELRGGKYQ